MKGGALAQLGQHTWLMLLVKIFHQGLKIIIALTGQHLPIHPLNCNERSWLHGKAVVLDQHTHPGKHRPLGQSVDSGGV